MPIRTTYLVVLLPLMLAPSYSNAQVEKATGIGVVANCRNGKLKYLSFNSGPLLEDKWYSKEEFMLAAIKDGASSNQVKASYYPMIGMVEDKCN